MCPDGMGIFDSDNPDLPVLGAVNNTCTRCERGTSSHRNITDISAAAPGPICTACELGKFARDLGMPACESCEEEFGLVCKQKHTKGCEEGQCPDNDGFCNREDGLCYCINTKFGINSPGAAGQPYDPKKYTYTSCTDENNLTVSFGSAIASLFVGIALFFYIVSPRGIGKFLRRVSTRMERPVSEISEEGVEEEDEDEEDDDQGIILAQASEVGESIGLREPRLQDAQDAGGQSGVPSLKSAWRLLGWPKLCTRSHPLRQLGTCCWGLIPEGLLAQLQIEAPVDFVLLIVFPPLFCVGYLLFDVFTMLLDAFLIMNNLAVLASPQLRWMSFPTVEVVMADIDLSLFSFLQDVNVTFSIDVMFIAEWWRSFAKVLGGIGNWVKGAMAGANVTCNGANRAVSYSGHVVLMAIMIMIIESHVGYAMRFSGAEQISKYILGSFHSSRATKLASKGTKVAAGKLKVRDAVISAPLCISRVPQF